MPRLLRRIPLPLIAALSLLILLTSLWFTWYAIARSRLNATLARIHTAGESIESADLTRHIVPTTLPTSNYLHQAIGAFTLIKVPQGAMPAQTTRQWDALIDRMIASNATALKAVRQARGFWEDPLNGRDLGTLDELSSLLTDAALRAHETGDDQEAVERIVDARHIASYFALSRQTSFFARRIEFRVIRVLRRIAPTLQTASDPSADPPTTAPADRTSVRSLILDLLDDQPVVNRVQNEFRYLIADDVDWLAHRQQALSVLRPMATLAISRSLDSRLKGLTAAQKLDFPAGLALLDDDGESHGPLVAGTSNQPRYSRLIQQGAADSIGLLELQWIEIAERRSIAIDLAIQLYRRDRGNWPQFLDDLVPNYLPRIPNDPFDSQDRPIEYVMASRQGQSRPMLKYNGRGVTSPPDEPQYQINGFRDYRTQTQWLDLSSLQVPAPNPGPLRTRTPLPSAVRP